MWIWNSLEVGKIIFSSKNILGYHFLQHNLGLTSTSKAKFAIMSDKSSDRGCPIRPERTSSPKIGLLLSAFLAQFFQQAIDKTVNFS